MEVLQVYAITEDDVSRILPYIHSPIRLLQDKIGDKRIQGKSNK